MSEPGHSLSRRGFTVKITVTRLFSQTRASCTARCVAFLSSEERFQPPWKRERRSGLPAENLSYRLDDSSWSPELAGTPTAPHQWPHVSGQAGLWGPIGCRAARSSVWPAAGLQVRALARGQYRRVLPRLWECPLVAAPVGPRAVPLADVAVEDVLDVLHDEVDGHCRDTRAGSAAARPATTRRYPRGTRFPPRGIHLPPSLSRQTSARWGWAW